MAIPSTVLQPAPSSTSNLTATVAAGTAAIASTTQPIQTPTSNPAVPIPTNFLPAATKTPVETATTAATVTPLPPAAAAVFREPVYPVVIVQDVVYGLGLRRSSWTAETGLQVTLLLDVYLPDVASERPRPAMVLFHGGGFDGGSADFPNMVSTAEFFAGRGWAVFVVDYRLGSDFGSIPTDRPLYLVEPFYPAGRDAKAAVRWLYANAEQYNVSTDHITALGGSAGAMLALMLGISEAADYRDEIDAAADPTLSSTYLAFPAEVQTVVSFWGDGLMLDALAEYDGRSRYDALDAPTLLVHGTHDDVVEIGHSEIVYRALADAGAVVEFYALFDYGHGAWEAVLEDGRTIYDLAFDFIVAQQGLVIGDG